MSEPEAAASFSPRRWAALTVLLVAGFMDLLDTTIVNVAIPSIRGHLNASYAAVQWLIAGYLLAVAMTLITSGRLGDLYGRKRVFLIGVAGFGLMSLACGLAPTAGFLIAARVLQGLGAALMITQILSVIQVSFPRAEQRKALTLYSSVAGLAVMSGPLLAGLLLDVFHLGWRSIFLINVPVSVIVTVAAIAIVPESRSNQTRKLDLGGVVLAGSAVFALVFSIIQGRAFGWPAWIFALMAASVPLIYLFTRWERRQQRRGGAPLVSMELFRDRSFSVGMLVVLVFFSGTVGFFLAFTVFLQLGLGYTPLQSALTTFPSSIGLIVAAQASAKLVPKLGRSILAIGAFVMAAAQAGLVLTVHFRADQLSPWDVRPVIFAFGLGMGLILPSLADVIIAGVHQRHAGAASGVLNTGMQVGNAVGVAIIGVILFSAIGSHAAQSAANVAPGVSRDLAALGLPPAASDAAITSFQSCFITQAQQQDPSATAPGCDVPGAAQLPAATRQRVSAVLTAAATQARENDFEAAVQQALLYEVGVFLATAALLFLLPRAARDSQAEQGEPELSDAVPDGAADLA